MKRRSDIDPTLKGLATQLDLALISAYELLANIGRRLRSQDDETIGKDR